MRKVLLLITVLLASASWVIGQERTVTGVVTSSEDGSPLIQLTVFLKGTTKGVVTDMDGRYSIKVPGPEAVLIFKYTGFDTQEIIVAEQREINVIMKPALEEIDEVMVVAFGKTTKSSFTGSAASVSSKELERKQVSNVVNALSGKVPGVTISSSNNQPGLAPTVRIRGEGSFSAGSGPLYVVDGVPFDGDISSINPADVESTTLLKDAASAALYGARGANGVIMITTKNGARGRGADPCNSVAHVTVTAKMGYNTRGIPEYDKITDPMVYMAKSYEAHVMGGDLDRFINRTVYFPFTLPNGLELELGSLDQIFVQQPDGSFKMVDGTTVGRLLTGPDGRQYWLQPDNWAKEAIRPGFRQEYNVSLSGAAKNVNYFVSGSYLNDKGYTIGSGYERYTARLRADYRPFSWLSVGGNMAFAGTNGDYLDETDAGNSSGNIFALTDFAGPIYPVYVRDGNKQIMKDQWGNTLYDYGTEEYPGLRREYLAMSNPISANRLNLNRTKSYMLNVKNYVDINLPYDFKFTANIGYDVDNTHSVERLNMFFGQFATEGGIISRGASVTTSLNLQQLLTWSHTYADVHNIDVLLGHEFYSQKAQGLSGNKKGLYRPDNEQLSGAINTPHANSRGSAYGTEGYLGRILYSYATRYFLSLSYRRDASSNFATEHRWGNFWSIGASWLISNEGFMEGTRDFVNMLKLKASYGVQGNDAIGAFRYTDLFELKNSNDHLALAFDRKGKKNITWETSHNFNIGVDFELFNRRLSGTIEFFSRTVYDMLFKRVMPPSAGYRSVYDNIGSMRNMGVDLELRGVAFQNENVTWSITVNGGHVSNKLLKLPDDWNKEELGGHLDGSSFYKEGGSIYDRLYPHFVRINEEGFAEYQVYDKQTNSYKNSTNGEAAVDKKSRKLYTDIASKFRGGFGTNVDFFGFDFGIAFTYSLGGKIYDATYAGLMHRGTSTGTAWHKDILKSWLPNRKSDKIPLVSVAKDAQFNFMGSDRYLVSRSFLSIDNITLGYTLPKKATEWMHIGSLRVYAVADNVWLFSARQGLDPRFGSGVGYKVIRSISGGIRLTF